MLTHIQATHHGELMTPCFHATLPFLMPIRPVLVPHSQHHLQDTIYLFLWETVRRGTDGTQHTYTPSPLSFLLTERMGERAGLWPCQGHHSQSPVLLASKLAHLHILQLIFQNSLCHLPMNGTLQQVQY